MTQSLMQITEGMPVKHEFGVYLGVIGKPEERLEDFVSKINNFCVDQEQTQNGSKGYSSNYIGEESRILAKSVLDYGISLMVHYENENPLELFLTTLRALEPLDCEDKRRYINRFNVFIDIEESFEVIQNDHIMPLTIQKVLSGLIKKYEPQFKKLKNHKRRKFLSQPILEQLKEDLDTFFKYTSGKFKQNTEYNPEARNISYSSCFPTDNKLTSDYVIELIEQNGSAKTLIEEFEVPLGMAIRGNKHTDHNTFVIYYGDPNHPQSIKVHHTGLNNRERSFYIALSSQITNPIPILAESTRKARDSLLHNQSFS